MHFNNIKDIEKILYEEIMSITKLYWWFNSLQRWLNIQIFILLIMKIYKWIYILIKKIITFHGQIQQNVSLSIVESEYINLLEYAKQGLWLKNLLEEVTNNKLLIKIKIDNKASITIVEDEYAKWKCIYIKLNWNMWTLKICLQTL